MKNLQRLIVLYIYHTKIIKQFQWMMLTYWDDVLISMSIGNK